MARPWFSPAYPRPWSLPLSAASHVDRVIGRIASCPLSLQLLLECVEEAPVGALGDDLLGRALDQADLVQAQRIEAHRVLGIILPPAIIRELLHPLQGVVVARGEPLLHKEPGSA